MLNPLFLSQALTLVKVGQSLDGDRAIQSYAAFALKDIHDRLREAGRGPSLDLLRREFAEIALHAIASVANEVSPELVERILGAQGPFDGEATIVGRATQAGLLEMRGDNRVGFQHPLYLEYFAAVAVESTWRSPLPDLSTDAGKQVARRLAPFLSSPSWLIEALLRIDAAAACECAAVTEPLPPSIAASLVAAVMPTLESRFPSDQRRALSLLGKVPSPEARQAVAAWWNALEPGARARLVPSVSDTFLSLEMAGAFDVILGHRRFWPEHPWYEPVFVTRIARLGAAFRQAMTRRARHELERDATPEEKRLRLVTMLAIFGDTSFVKVLRARVDRGEHLSDAEVRALIHANTEDAMEVYAVGVDNVHAVPLEQQPGNDDDARKQSRAYRRDQLVLRTVDIHMYPHDALTTLAEDALSSPCATPVMWFGASLAAFLGEERLLVPYTSAMRRRGRGYISFGNQVAETLLRRSPPEVVVGLYAHHEDADIRRQIVHSAHDVPGRRTEEFLFERIGHGDFVFEAVQSLGLLRCYRAGGTILKVLFTAANEWTRGVCIRALGMIRYAPAERALCAALRRQPTERGAESDYLIPSALALLGGEFSVTTLEKVFPGAPYPERILGALFGMRATGARETATRLALLHRVSARVLAEALDYFDDDELRRKRSRGDLDDPRLLELLLGGADDVLAVPSMATMHYIPAVARFALPAATAFLERVAAGTGMASFEALEALAALGREGAIRECIERELGSLEGASRFVSSFDADRLSAWPPAMVRRALLARIEKGAHIGRWLFLLQWFVQAEDLVLFRRIELGEDVGAADVAHEYLRDGRRIISVRSRGP
jgi:hypothetical protein